MFTFGILGSWGNRRGGDVPPGAPTIVSIVDDENGDSCTITITHGTNADESKIYLNTDDPSLWLTFTSEETEKQKTGLSVNSLYRVFAVSYDEDIASFPSSSKLVRITDGGSPLKELEAAFLKHLSDNWSETAVHWPGTEFDSKDAAEWIVPRIPRVEEPPTRTPIANERRDVTIGITIFVKYSTSTFRVRELEDELRQILRHEEIDVPGGGASRLLRLDEPDFVEIPAEENIRQVEMSIDGVLEMS